MNVSLNLSASQLSKLRNGHGIRIGPAMFGKGVDMIIPYDFQQYDEETGRRKRCCHFYEWRRNRIK